MKGLEASRGALTEVVGSFPTRGNKIFCFRSDNEAKRGIEFRHSTPNASRMGWKMENGSVLLGTEYLNT